MEAERIETVTRGVKAVSYKKRVAALKADFERQLSQSNGRQKMSLKRGSSNLFRPRRDNDGDNKLDLTDFDHPLWIDRSGLTATVEARISYDELTKATLKFGLMPAVVPELKSITPGGAVSGIGIESSSYRCGLVHETVQEMDIFTGKGEVVTCSPTENADLFYGFPNSYGTLGYALRLKMKLIPVKPFVRLEHVRYQTAQDLFSALSSHAMRGTYDFLEGVVFSPQEMYLTSGDFRNEALFISNYAGREIYYESIRHRDVDCLQTYDYLWRWDTDWFWRSDVFGAQIPWIRALWPKSRLNSATYHKLMRFSQRFPRLMNWLSPFSESIIQDVLIPINSCEEFLYFLLEQIGVAPIWICPTRMLRGASPWTIFPLKPDRFYVNFGFWGSVPKSITPSHYNRVVERKVAELGGLKSLYSTSYYSQQQFAKTYNGRDYLFLKDKYDPDRRFPNLYEKAVGGR